MSSDLENFIVADENRINMFNIELGSELTDQVFLVDYQRQKAANEDEIITSAKFSDKSCMFLYTTSQGKIRLCDLRESSNFLQRPSLEFSVGSSSGSSYFSQWLDSVSDATFVPGNENLICSRNILSTMLWDVRRGVNAHTADMAGMTTDLANTTAPIFKAQVTDYLEHNLVKMVDDGMIEDSFSLDVSPDGKYIATGAYNKSGHVMDLNATSNQSVVCKFDQSPGTPVGALKVYNKKKRLIQAGPSASGTAQTASKKADLRKRVGLQKWKPLGQHETTHTLAQVYRNCIYLYNGTSSKTACSSGKAMML